MKYYILGASGFIGSYLANYFSEKGNNVLTERVDITDLKALQKAFRDNKPDVVVNCAGVRAYPNIDWCENHKKETVNVNVAGATNAMSASLDVGAYPIQITSGCIYNDGPEKEFTEEDPPNFYGSFYSRMRIVLQNALKELPIMQVRIRMPISRYSHPRNLINKLVGYQKVISVPNSATLIEDIGPALEKLVNERITGILNMTNEGYIENKNILALYKKLVDPSHEYELISVQELEKDLVKAARSNCVLSMSKAKSLGISMPSLDGKRLKQVLLDYKNVTENSI